MEPGTKRPLLEVLSWIAGILGTCVAIYAAFATGPTKQDQSPPSPSASAPTSAASEARAQNLVGVPTTRQEQVLEAPTIQFPAQDFAKSMSTRHGEIIVSSALLSRTQRTQAILNGAELPDAESLGYIVSVFAAITWRDKTAFVVAGSNGGSCCPWNVYSLVILNGAGKYHVVRDDRFLGNLSKDTVSLKGNEVAFDLGFQSKKQTVAFFDGQRIRFEQTYIAGTTLSRENCEWLYEEALDDCARFSPSCGEQPTTGYALRGYAALRNNHPGFNSLEFESLCRSVCETKKRPSMQAFQATVCRLN